MNGLEVGMWVSRVARLIDVRFGALCKIKFDLLASEAQLLLVLRRSGRPFALRPTDLFRAQLLTSAAITKQVHQLCARGLVVRNRDPLHAGGYLVQLTADGLRTADTLLDELLREGSAADQIAALWTELEPEEARVIRGFMLRVLTISEASAKEAQTVVKKKRAKAD
ncbi:MarR family winged helix-turn-helix transcriptional regulator [Hydrogenophaga sp.]|uniref:MarR family winged helix-turn-helix transcriptional regulator n=1 Tax=Hydrogenophaga sp. TaxID=1904254 RepID=UPI002729EF1C|nr:MarR family winged helix-turn-helix transcriptional regulator [Hydrogenophaga sp.]